MTLGSKYRKKKIKKNNKFLKALGENMLNNARNNKRQDANWNEELNRVQVKERFPTFYSDSIPQTFYRK